MWLWGHLVVVQPAADSTKSSLISCFHSKHFNQFNLFRILLLQLLLWSKKSLKTFVKKSQNCVFKIAPYPWDVDSKFKTPSDAICQNNCSIKKCFNPSTPNLLFNHSEELYIILGVPKCFQWRTYLMMFLKLFWKLDFQRPSCRD